jgi:Tfp pilus assembly protein PilX
MRYTLRTQRGIALPVMLLILMVMLVGTVTLFKASNSSTLTSANMAYDTALAKAADLGLLTGYQWLNDTALADRTLLQDHHAGNGYRATLDTTLTTRSDAFWTGFTTVTDTAGNKVDYVVHRLCDNTGAPGSGTHCVQTVSLGEQNNQSLAVDSANPNNSTLMHYVVTARINGARGGNVVTQLVVLIGGT